MNLIWRGHSCFQLLGKESISVITDPYDETVGYGPLLAKADIVTISHQHYDHNCAGAVLGNPTIVDTPGQHVVNGVKIEGFETFHDNKQGFNRGSNILYKIMLDGVCVCHCGDLGHVVDERLAEKIGHIDVLLIPIGGRYTVDAQGALDNIERLKPNIVVPMHYRTHHCKLDIDTTRPFIELAQGVYDVGYYANSELTIDPSDPKKRTRITIMEYQLKP